MKKITQMHLIIANILLFVVSLGLLEYSKTYRMNQELHWIYSFGHNWWFMVALPSAFWGSTILAVYSYFKRQKEKLFYIFLSFIPLFLFLFLIFILF